MELDRKKGSISYEGLYLCYKIHQIPQTDEGAVEKLLLQMLGQIEPELAECAGNYRSRIMDERFDRLHTSWAKDRKVQEFYADKVQLGAALAVLKPDRPVGYAIKDCVVDSKKKQELMEIEEFKSLYQRLNNWLTDDGSTDGSAKLCGEYERQNPKVRTIIKEHSGVSKTRNAGIAAARGEYIAFVDSDDRIDTDYLERLAQGIGDRDLVIASFDRKFYKDGKLVKTVECRMFDAAVEVPRELGGYFSALYTSSCFAGS